MTKPFDYESLLAFEQLLADIQQGHVNAQIIIKPSRKLSRKPSYQPQRHSATMPVSPTERKLAQQAHQQRRDAHTHTQEEHNRWLRQLIKKGATIAILDSQDGSIIAHQQPKSVQLSRTGSSVDVVWRKCCFQVLSDNPVSKVPALNDDRFILVAPSFQEYATEEKDIL